MKLDLTGGGVIALAAVAAVAGLGFYVYTKRGAIAQAAGAAVDAVNPASSSNLAYTGVNKAGAAITGDDSFSLGSWLYDKLNPGVDAHITASSPPPVNSAIADRWDYYTQAGRTAGSGSGGASGGW